MTNEQFDNLIEMIGELGNNISRGLTGDAPVDVAASYEGEATVADALLHVAYRLDHWGGRLVEALDRLTAAVNAQTKEAKP